MLSRRAGRTHARTASGETDHAKDASFWRRHQRSLAFLLYLDLKTRMWLESPPPQFCSPSDVRFNATFDSFAKPPDHWRLAGSIRSLPNHSAEEAMVTLSPVDGLHLVFDPCRAWLAFSAFLCQEGQIQPIAGDPVVLDECDEYVNFLGDRVWLTDQL